MILKHDFASLLAIATIESYIKYDYFLMILTKCDKVTVPPSQIKINVNISIFSMGWK